MLKLFIEELEQNRKPPTNGYRWNSKHSVTLMDILMITIDELNNKNTSTIQYFSLTGWWFLNSVTGESKEYYHEVVNYQKLRIIIYGGLPYL